MTRYGDPVRRLTRYGERPGIVSDPVQWPSTASDLVRWVTCYSEWPVAVSGPIQWVTRCGEWPGIVSDPVQWVSQYSDLVQWVTRCLIPHWIWNALLKKGKPETRAPTLWGNPCTILKTNYWSCNIVHVKQDALIIDLCQLEARQKEPGQGWKYRERCICFCKSYKWCITPTRTKWIAVEKSNNLLTGMFKTQRDHRLGIETRKVGTGNSGCYIVLFRHPLVSLSSAQSIQSFMRCMVFWDYNSEEELLLSL